MGNESNVRGINAKRVHEKYISKYGGGVALFIIKVGKTYFFYLNRWDSCPKKKWSPFEK
jgi:hypothetical protein